jgi:hypothetical protein
MRDERGTGPKRKYYAHRKGHYPYLTFDQILDLFGKEVLDYIEGIGYLNEAQSYIGDPRYFGTWGPDIPAFILKTLQMENIWPFAENLPNYDMMTFFTVIEFIYDYVSKPIEKRNKIVGYEKAPAQDDYREMVNSLLSLYCHRYSTEFPATKYHEKFYDLSLG